MNHNFCRIADPSDPRPWCYTTDPNVKFDYCNCSVNQTILRPWPPTPNPRPMSGPMCQPDAGTITRPFSFEYAKYDNSASVVQHAHPRSNGNGNINRIFGGKDAEPGEVPWQVNLFIDGTQLNNLMCGGTLVSYTVRFVRSEILTKIKCRTLLLMTSFAPLPFEFEFTETIFSKVKESPTSYPFRNLFKKVISAAHCFKGESGIMTRWTVIAGHINMNSQPMQRRRLRNLQIHP